MNSLLNFVFSKWTRILSVGNEFSGMHKNIPCPELQDKISSAYFLVLFATNTKWT